MTMCRLLAVASSSPVDAGRHLDAFRRLCRESREYQGHGWGCAVWRDGRWERYRTVRPVWEDDYLPEGEVRAFVAHARSAFRNEGIEEENNMPFLRGSRAFVFNGEMRGVRLGLRGRTGADKLFALLGAMDRGDAAEAINRTTAVIVRRSARIRACNFILAEPGRFHLHALFDGEADYFTMAQRRTDGELVICSEPYPGDEGPWEPLPSGTRRAIAWS